MGKRWYYQCEGRVLGPVSSGELLRKARDEQIDRDTPVRVGSDGEWGSAGKVKGLFVDLPAQPVDAPPNGAEQVEPADAGGGAAGSAAPTQLDQRQARFPGLPRILSSGVLVGGIFGAALLVVSVMVGFWTSISRDDPQRDSSLAVDAGSDAEPPIPSPASAGFSGSGRDGNSLQAGAGAGYAPADEGGHSQRPSRPDVSLVEAGTDKKPGNGSTEPLSSAEGAVSVSHDDGVVVTAAEFQERPTDRPGGESAAGPTVVRPGSPGETPDDPLAGVPGGVVPSAHPAPDGPPTVEPGSAPDQGAAKQEGLDDRLAEMRKLLEQHRSLFDDLQAATRDRQQAEQQLAALVAASTQTAALHDARVARAAAIQQEMLKVRGDIGSSARTPFLDTELAVCLSEVSSLRQQAALLQSQMAAVQPQVAGAKEKLAWNVQAAERLLQRWFPLCDPFGKLEAVAHRRSLEHLSAWIVEAPAFPPLYLARGFARLRLEDYDLASKDFEEAARLYPALLPVTTAAKGYALARQGQARSASEHFRKALELSPKSGVIYVFRGHAFLLQKSYAYAERQFLQAVMYDDTLAEAHRALAFVRAARPDPSPTAQKETIKHATTACELTNWGDWTCLDTLAMAYAAAGQFGSAIEMARQALHITPIESRAHLERRLTLYEAGQPYRIE